MSEKGAIQHELPLPTEQGYQMVDMLTSGVVLGQRRTWLSEQLQDPELARYGQLEDAIIEASTKGNEAYRAREYGESNRQAQVAEELAAAQKEFPDAIRLQYDSLTKQLMFLERFHSLTVDNGEVEARVLQRFISRAPQVQPDANDRAPFDDWRQNQEAARYVPDEEIKGFLAKRVFVDTDRIKGRAHQNRVHIEAQSEDSPIEIPLDLIVYLEGFDSWLGRGIEGSDTKDVGGEYSKYYDGKISSLDLIKHYASLPSDLPPVDTIRLFIQPDGTIFGDNASGDSHRIAAAALRGDTTIKARNITIQCLDENIIMPLATERQTT